MVKRDGLVDKLHVRADGTGLVGHAGSALIAGVADRVGLTRALSAAMAGTRHNPCFTAAMIPARCSVIVRGAGHVSLDEPAREQWHHAYRQLATQPADGIVGRITGRAEAHIIRLALIYALTDGVKQIGPAHLTAAVALHDYAARSAAWR